MSFLIDAKLLLAIYSEKGCIGSAQNIFPNFCWKMIFCTVSSR